MELKDATVALGGLAQETRLRCFRLLVRAGAEGMAAGEIARRLDVPANTLSTHLALLASAGLVQGQRAGRSVVYRADFAGMARLIAYLTEDCCAGHPEICGVSGDALLCPPKAASGDSAAPDPGPDAKGRSDV